MVGSWLPSWLAAGMVVCATSLLLAEVGCTNPGQNQVSPDGDRWRELGQRLVRRDFLRFGKREDPDEADDEDDSITTMEKQQPQHPSAPRGFLRFGRGDEDDDEAPPDFRKPPMRLKRPSQGLDRWGGPLPDLEDDDDDDDDEASRDKRKNPDFLRFGRNKEISPDVAKPDNNRVELIYEALVSWRTILQTLLARMTEMQGRELETASKRKPMNFLRFG